MAAGSAAERAEAKGRASARKRGREVWLPVSHLVFCLSFCLFCSPANLLLVCAATHVGPCLTFACCYCTYIGPCCLIAISMVWHLLPLMSCQACSFSPIQRFMVDVQVVMTFSMQGVGNFTNTAVLCILLVIYGSAEANKRTHKYTGWRYPSPPCLLAAWHPWAVCLLQH